MLKEEIVNLINKIPKAELHIHIEGSLEPELMFTLAKRNQIKLKYDSVEAIKEAYNFSNLQDFLDIYYAGASVLITEQDFFEMTLAYLTKAALQNIRHVEIFFDPQTHTERGISMATVIQGISRALSQANQDLNISSKLILCFLRHLDEQSAFSTLEMALPYKEQIYAIGLDSSEVGNPPSKFQNVFAKARSLGFKLVAHAGEEGPESYVREAINLLQVDRIDHGNHSLDNPELVKELVQKQIPLTVCPLSNLKLKVTPDLTKHPLKKMLELGLLAMINSDDPAYFGGYLNENYLAISEALNLSMEDIKTLAKNSFKASFLTAAEKDKYIQEIEEF